jgi:Bacterial PH domain
VWIRKTPQDWALARPLQFAAALLAAFSAFAAGLTLFASLTVAGNDFLYILPMAVISYAAARTSVMSVDVRTEGVRVVNPLRIRNIPWEEFARFGVGSWHGWRASVLVQRRDRHSVPVFVFASNPMYEDARVSSIVEELNRLAASVG